MQRRPPAFGGVTIPVIPIYEAADPRVAPYLSIREKDLTKGHGGRFIAEGKVTLASLIQRSRFEIESLFLAENRLKPLAHLLGELPASIPIYTAQRDIMDAVAGFPIHRGVLACAKKGTALAAADLLARAQTVLVLIGLSNHDNVGACFRNAAAFGADAIFLDETSCDPLYRKSIRVSAGAALFLPFFHRGTGANILNTLSAADFTLWCLTPDRSAEPIGNRPHPAKLALVLGPEGPGLPETLLAQGKNIRIPMAAGFDSLNVATAGAIALSTVLRSQHN